MSHTETFSIATQWDGTPLPAKDHVKLSVCSQSAAPHSIVLKVEAPFYDDPAPPAPSGSACDQLWDYEVVEAFFLGPEEKYLEVELCPLGQHLILTLEGVRCIKKHMLPLEFTANVDKSGGRWTGEALIPLEYFPPSVTHFNAYAIHGTGDDRVYSSLYPAAAGQFEQPDFHRLQFFKEVDFSAVCNRPLPAASGSSKFW
ncbi:UPF0462 protein C4orf33 homolog isoform X2 [Sycon ciliatum]|uniref:UPF0462 protein C4orf33 homolog isoform X2 n=1 Tax=Sycon ciliatum TaxID=27933 RepID=UPI0020AB0E6B|eukprot:scpid98411/ scgid1053/ UPF0462 protein C4orf33 homolog